MKDVFKKAISVLPNELQQIILKYESIWEGAEEVRVRVGFNPVVIKKGQSVLIKNYIVTDEDINETVNRATDYSMHSFRETLKNGFITSKGGHRIGVCGTAIIENGSVMGFKWISSLNIRVAHEMKGVANDLVNKIRDKSTIIISPPALGKTTLLRDIVRQLSDSGTKVSVADERGEICGDYKGKNQFDIGQNTDYMSFVPKADGAMMLIKAMSPQIIVLDEITSSHDIEAVALASHSGVRVIATAHAFNFEDFCSRPLYRKLLDLNFFDNIASIEVVDGERKYKLKELGSDTYA